MALAWASLQQPSCLRVVAGLSTQATACIALAGLQDEGKTIWPAPGVQAVKQADRGRGREAQTAVDIPVLSSHDLGQFAAFLRNAQPLAQLPQQLHAAALMA